MSLDDHPETIDRSGDRRLLAHADFDARNPGLLEQGRGDPISQRLEQAVLLLLHDLAYQREGVRVVEGVGDVIAAPRDGEIQADLDVDVETVPEGSFGLGLTVIA